MAAVCVASTLGLLALPSVFGNEMIYNVHPADVAASQWFEEKTPEGSELLLVVPAYPKRTTGYYDRHLLADDPLAPNLLREVEGFDRSTRTGSQLLAFTRSYTRVQTQDHNVYLAVGPTQRAYIKYYGLVDERALDEFLSGLLVDPEFQLVYERDGSYLFKAG